MTRDFLFWESLIVIQAKSANARSSASILEAVRRQDPLSSEILLERFGTGLCFLAKRRFPEHTDKCVSAVIELTAEAIRNGDGVNEGELPSLIHRQFRIVASSYPQTWVKEELKILPEEVVGRLNIFTPIQLQALHRYYVMRESASSICFDLGLPLDRFRFVRSVARHAMDVGDEQSSMRKKPPQHELPSLRLNPALAG